MENRFEDSDHFKGSMEILQQHYPDPEELIKGLMQMAHSMELLSGKKTPVLLPNITLIDDRTCDIRKIARFLKRSGCEVEMVSMTPSPNFVAEIFEDILAHHPDLVITNVRPFSSMGFTAPYGLVIGKLLSKFSEIPVSFYFQDGEELLKALMPKIGRLNELGVRFSVPISKKKFLNSIFPLLQYQVAMELRMVKKDLEKAVKLRTQELKAANDQLHAEIIERRRAEEAAIESKHRIQAIFEAAQDCIFIKDGRLRYTMVNPATQNLLNLGAAEIVGHTSEEIFGKEIGKHIREIDLRVLGGETIEEERVRPINGVPLTFHDITVPLRDSSGEIIGVCGISRDVTDRKMAEPPPPHAAGDYPSSAMKSIMERVNLAAETESTVLLLGESGSGKDHLARYIHDHSKRKDGPYWAINCAVVSGELAHPELFGHERGSFTGAVGRKRGLLELAEGGTLLLNEIGELSVPLQAKLLTFLDTRQFTRLGGEKNVTVNARLIAATNKDLEKEVKARRFRFDLYHRLNVFSVVVPPLRERREDIPTLVQEILERLCTDMQLSEVPPINAATLYTLKSYEWPGNVRELRNVLERALILGRGKKMSIDLPEFRRIDHPPDVEKKLDDPPPSPASIAWPQGYKIGRPVNPGREKLLELKKKYIDEKKWPWKKLAHEMGISTRTLRNWCKDEGISEAESGSRQ